MPTAACVGCRYDLSKTPGDASSGWRCSECGRINSFADLAYPAWTCWKGWMFVPRILTVLALSVLNLFVLFLIASWLVSSDGMVLALTACTLLCLFEGLCWVAVTRHGAPKFPLRRWAGVSLMLLGAGGLALMAGVMWLLQGWPVC